jgi:hypothetical protein
MEEQRPQVEKIPKDLNLTGGMMWQERGSVKEQGVEATNGYG